MIAQSFKSASKALALLPLCVLASLSASAAPTTFYPQPEPTAQEQHLLELINRARSNPAAEGQMLASVTDPEILRYYSHYGVDTNKLRSDFAGYEAQPPLAFNANLMTSSRAQSLDQAAHGFQGHNGTRWLDLRWPHHRRGLPVARARRERVRLRGKPPLRPRRPQRRLGRAQPRPPPEHHEHQRELPGVQGNRHLLRDHQPGDFGPQVITEDFGTPANANTAYLVGVVYNDLNGNGQYDEGEGLGGVTSPRTAAPTTRRPRPPAASPSPCPPTHPAR